MKSKANEIKDLISKTIPIHNNCIMISLKNWCKICHLLGEYIGRCDLDKEFDKRFGKDGK